MTPFVETGKYKGDSRLQKLKPLKFVCCLILFSVILSWNGFAAETVYVQSIKAKIMSAPSFSADVVFIAERGDPLTVLGRSDGWIKVEKDKTQGWVNDLLVGDSKPMQKLGMISGEQEKIEHNARRRASSITSPAAARGLTDTDLENLDMIYTADYDALKKLKAIAENVTQADIDSFVNQRR